MADYLVRPLPPDSIPSAAALLARGMQNNPNHIAAIGNNPARRVAAFTGIFTSVLDRVSRHGETWGAYQNGELVGVCAAVPPGHCEPTSKEKIVLLISVARHAGLLALPKALSWLGAWAKHDPRAPHWHLGPIAVDFGKQGRGIGRALMDRFCERVDAASELAYLETDKGENVAFYEAFGFRVTENLSVLKVPNWLMLRKAAAP